MDPRDRKLSELLVGYSTRIKAGDNVLIEYEGAEITPLVCQLVKDVYAAGGRPFVNSSDSLVTRQLLLGADEAQLDTLCRHQMTQMQDMDAYIAIRGGANSSELADVPTDQMNLYYAKTAPVLDYRCSKTRWVILRYPNASMAQLAGTSREAFADFYYNVCTLDYARMNEAMTPLQRLMQRTDQVRIEGPGTDLCFSIKGIPAVKCAGECNIPDGELYTAPVRDSMNGVISYNTPSLEQGFKFENIRFEIENGRIVKATANDTDRINRILDTDEGARYFGEFSFGFNPYILEPMLDTLFDEKIAGSFHLTPGMAYEDAPNGNDSAVHWDLVMIQRPEYGGGDIYFDDVLVRRDGRFVLPELEGLNPENLK